MRVARVHIPSLQYGVNQIAVGPATLFSLDLRGKVSKSMAQTEFGFPRSLSCNGFAAIGDELFAFVEYAPASPSMPPEFADAVLDVISDA